jgi:hypothetical protein
LLELAEESNGAHTAGRQQGLRLELPPLEALLLQRMSGALRPPMRQHLPTGPHLPPPIRPDLSQQGLMARRAMATAQDPTLMP